MLGFIVAVGSAVAVVALSAFLFRKFGAGSEDSDPGGPTVGHAGAMLSALFLLVFAIAIVVPWTTADAARQNTYTESQSAVEAYWAANELPAPAAAQVQAGLRDYVGFVVDREWPLMADGQLSAEGTTRLNTLRIQASGLVVDGDDQEDAKAAVVDQISQLSSSRRQRAADAGATPPTILLALTVVTGLIVLVFPFLAGARPRGMALLPMLAMAGLLGVGIYMVFDIIHVFDGGLAVMPDAFTSALAEFGRISGLS
ncbi:DUF4239 domain-containing protein [Herbidospora mongoliensis]|uniref:bestrophin-like domain n=1 Tax=Herbidospora mongoliensis TaxID=688067 RepID=UPI0008319B24|nr:DUF4239 domain-containing protein [Herbidospora mongoliensis]